jgi:hypothetical protein
VYLEVPDVERVLREGAFWDVYYEHCCYFGAGSFARLARRDGLDVLDLRAGFQDQYLLLFGRPGRIDEAAAGTAEIDRLRDAARRFEELSSRRLEHWGAVLADLRASGRRAVLWGSGSKAVAFLTALDAGDEVDAVVDINPRKQGSFLAGVARPVVAPSHLSARPPDLVIAMNPAYVAEIGDSLARLGVSAPLVAV